MVIGCLCIHGFTGSPYEVEPLMSYLEDHTDWKIVAPILPGHGEEGTLLHITYQQWIDAVEEALESLVADCETIYVVGFSMGGLLAAYLATKYPIDKLVLLSAAAYYVNIRQLLIDIREMAADGIKGHLQDNTLYQRYRKKIMDTPVSATKQFRMLVKHIKPRLKDVHNPTLIIQGECDGIVPTKSAHYIFKHIGTEDKKLVFLDSSPHHVCHGPDFEQLVEEISTFFEIL
ncbi:alpha/beta hydrolase [Bacillus pinisoli]|uniref:alpha/beta hydrolase n=1 Tax=Bacillus pinisoli TaxID=2901866 RepID=UPI002342CB63|nr:alpha/beta fold hydrolase [Bacillus pinisoli]